MANLFAVTDLVAKESLRVAHESLQMIGTVDRQYDSSYDGTGGHHGATLRVKSPNQYKRRQGSRVMDVQDQAEATQTITVATQDGVDMRFNSQELIQSVDNQGKFDNLSKQYITPAIKGMVSGIEADAIAYWTKATANLVGTAGTAMTKGTVPGLARARLNQNLAPKDGERYVQIESTAMASIVDGVATFFNPNADISKAFREGMIGRNAMADWYENDRMWTMPNGADVAGEINAGTLTSGITTLTVDGFTAAPVAGMVFTVEGTYDVHPETKVAYPYLKQFTVVSATTTSITFSPAIIYDTTNPRQNCSGAPTDNDDITFVGSLSTNYVQQLMYHKDAYQFTTAALPIMDDAQKCVRVSQDNLSLRVWMASDIRNDELLMRVDILYGLSALRQEWGCRMIGAAG
jgi:coat protein Gp5